MDAAAALAAALPALAVGSFLNVVVARVPDGRSLVRPRSSCGSCGSAILWRDNVPLLSWLLLRGRCRRCRGRISPLYPAVEALTAALVVACVAVYGPTPYGLLAAGFCSVLVALSAIDAQRRAVPDRIVLPSAAVVLGARIAIDPSAEWALSALAAGGALALGVHALPRLVRLDDAKVALLAGAMLGSAVVVAFAASVLALIAALVLATALRGDSGSSRLGVPLAPFLAASSVVSLFLGPRLLAAVPLL
ncbi:MAG: prepilin peptidase [Thermoleophilia bacterium]|nr:prepilin peptidase [Gaiellaceae bacterium]MDW8338284.1 prepilin peptidase [Thermoleophilia bacterium]